MISSYPSALRSALCALRSALCARANPGANHLLSRSRRTAQVVRTIYGLVLLVSATLKGCALISGALSDHIILSSPRLQAAAALIEFLIGLWLISGCRPLTASWTAAGLFSLFAAVSLYLGLLGQRSCGCLGQVTMSPWITLAFDVAAVLALLSFRPSSERSPSGPVRATGALRFLLGTMSMIAIIVGAFIIAVPDPARTLARLRGDFVTAEPSLVQVGSGLPGETRQFQVTLTNHSDRPIRISGGTASCNCLATEDLPVLILFGGSQSVRVSITFRGSAGLFQHHYAFFTEDPSQRTVVCGFRGRVTQRVR